MRPKVQNIHLLPWLLRTYGSFVTCFLDPRWLTCLDRTLTVLDSSERYTCSSFPNNLIAGSGQWMVDNTMTPLLFTDPCTPYKEKYLTRQMLLVRNSAVSVRVCVGYLASYNYTRKQREPICRLYRSHWNGEAGKRSIERKWDPKNLVVTCKVKLCTLPRPYSG